MEELVGVQQSGRRRPTSDHIDEFIAAFNHVRSQQLGSVPSAPLLTRTANPFKPKPNPNPIHLSSNERFSSSPMRLSYGPPPPFDQRELQFQSSTGPRYLERDGVEESKARTSPHAIPQRSFLASYPQRTQLQSSSPSHFVRGVGMKQWVPNNTFRSKSIREAEVNEETYITLSSRSLGEGYLRKVLSKASQTTASLERSSSVDPLRCSDVLLL